MAIPAVYFCPHQDDETLTFSLDVLRHIAAGRPTYIVLFTTGNSTGATGAINGTVGSSWWGGTHSPSLEGYDLLTPSDVQVARNHEFFSACGQLGIPKENIILDQLLDADVNVANVKTLMRKYVTQFGSNASFKTMSKYDTQAQHVVGANALLELYNAGEITDARFWLSRYDVINSPTIGRAVTAPTTSELDKIKKACRPYCAWNPSAGAYAFGYHSVPSQFDSMINNPVFKYFLPTD